MELKDLVTNILTSLGFENPEITINEQADRLEVVINLSAEESGMLIGFHGEKIDAFQLILNLIHNNNSEKYIPINVDINGYRLTRATSIDELADKAALKAIESGREILLPPLPPNERRLVHLHLSENPQVSTYSEGEGKTRRVVVRPNTQQTN